MRRWYKNKITLIYLRLKYGSRLQLQSGCRVGGQSQFEGANKIYEQAAFSGSLGYGSYIGPGSRMNGVHVGRFTSIGPDVVHNPGTHPYTSPYATTCPMFYSTEKQNGETWVPENKFQEKKFLEIDGKQYSLRIGNDCWIGQRVFIAGGVCIHDGAVVLAGAVVTKDIPAYAIAGGIPAKIIKYRYDEQTIQTLLGTQWWKKDIDWLKKNASAFCDINKLTDILKSEYYAV